MVEVAPIVDSGRTGWAAAAASGTPMPQPILLPPAPVAAPVYVEGKAATLKRANLSSCFVFFISFSGCLHVFSS